jgi:predicted Kef-type K+ transport protein
MLENNTDRVWRICKVIKIKYGLILLLIAVGLKIDVRKIMAVKIQYL